DISARSRRGRAVGRGAGVEVAAGGGSARAVHGREDAGRDRDRRRSIEFLDQQGNRLSVDTISPTYHCSSGFGRLSGVSALIKPNRRFTFQSVGPEVTLIASVDLPSQRVNATLVDSRPHRWLTSMRNASTMVPMTPTGTPTPAAAICSVAK